MNTTLYLRLLEICTDRGIDDPKNKHIQDLLHLSSGRVTQIKNEGEAASLGEESMARLDDLGYRRDWVKNGIPPKLRSGAHLRAEEPFSPYSTLSEDALALARWFDSADPDLKTAVCTLIDRVTMNTFKKPPTILRKIPTPENGERSDVSGALTGTPSPLDPTIQVRGFTFHHTTKKRRKSDEPHA